MGSEIIAAVLSGCLGNLPEKESSVVRIFLSSTFTDMQAERNWLMKNAFPHLRKFCQERGLDFQIADMRWGVREDATDDHRTTELCLHEIKNCQRLSRGPNFVTFLGDKYGFRPIPSEIEASEFKLLKNTAIKLGHDISLLLTWYQCDFNREPNMYTLQPISMQYPHYFDMTPANALLRQQAQREWWSVVEKLSSLLRESADHLCREDKMSQERKHRYYQSVTENEVHAGILSVEGTRDKVLCFQRTLIDIRLRDSVAGRFTDMIEGYMDTEAEKLREDLRMVKVPAKMPSANLFRYNILWDKIGINAFKNQEHISYIKAFGNDFITSIERMITASLSDQASTKYRSPLFEEILHHLHFCRTKCESFCGRKNILEEIQQKIRIVHKLDTGAKENVSEEYAENAEDVDKNKEALLEERKQIQTHLESLDVVFSTGDDFNDIESDPNFNLKDRLTKLPEITEFTKPLFVHGKSGSGKTAVMAKVGEMSKVWFPESVLMIRFLGTSTKSTTIREVILSLSLQICETYKEQKQTGIDLESDYQFLIKYFAALLWKINTQERNLVIILDSVDQLNPADHAHMFSWLPHKLPPGVHVLVSVVSDRLDCLNNARLLFHDADQYVEITELEIDAAIDIINVLCKKSNRHLSKKQKNLILDHFANNGQPLYLRLLLDMSLSWKSFTEVDGKALGVTVKEAINHLFDNLEKNHGAEIVKKSIGYLCAAKEGLTEAEMEDILSLDDEVLQDTYIYHLPPDPEVIRLPPLLWKRVEFDISEYVVERQSGGKKVVTWYHRQFMEAATERYLTQDVRKRFHQVLGEYFQGTWSVKSKPLQLTKGKKGDYPVAMRQVPAQPIKFGPGLYNIRKLSELPYALIQSDQFESALTDLLTDPEWLYAKCCTMTLTSLMEDFRLAESRFADCINKKQAELEAIKRVGKKEDPYQVARLKLDEEVFEALKFVTRMVLLAADSVRKNPVNLPVMLLSQLGPDYKGSVFIEKFVERCSQWCEECHIPLLVPTRECMIKPGGYLLYTINADVAITGEKRDKSYKGVFLREDTMQLYAVTQQSARPDQISVFDLHDNGSCITMDDVGLYIRNINFVGDNKYLLLDVYTKKDAYDPVSYEQLYESSTASPVVFDPKPSLIAVSSTGRFVACSTGNSVAVYKKDRHSKFQPFYTSNIHEQNVTALFISPDETLLVTTDKPHGFIFGKKEGSTSFVHDIKTKQKVHDIDPCLDINKSSLVSKSNLLVTIKSGYKHQGTLIVFDLAQGKIVHEVVVNETYTLEVLQFHLSEESVFVYYKDTGVINGIQNKYAELVNITSGNRFGKSPQEFKGPYSGGQVFGTDSLYYAVCRWNSCELAIFFAGLVNSPLKEAVLIHVLIGHNQPIRELVVPTSLGMMLSVSHDNTVKVWDLKSVLEHFHTELTKIELCMVQKSSDHMSNHLSDTRMTFDLADIVAHYKPADTAGRPETTQLALNRFGDTLYVGTDNSKLQWYDVDTAKLKMSSDLDIGPIQLLQLSKKGRYMIAAGYKQIHVEDLQSQKKLTLEARGKISCMAESNNILVAGSAGMEAKGRVWNIETGDVVKDFELLYSFYCVAINSLGTQVVSSMFEFPVIVNLLEDEEEPFLDPSKMDTMMTGAVCCQISPDDKMAAMCSTDGAMRVITMKGKYIYRLQQKSSAISMAFVPDGTAILSAGYRSIYVWSLLDGSCKYKLTRHMDFVNGMKFDSSGRYIVTISRDKQLVLWDFQRVVSIATFQANCQINAVDISTKTGTIAYIPEGISDVAILKPNKALRNVMAGNIKTVPLTSQAQALALTFSGQRVNESEKSKSCIVS